MTIRLLYDGAVPAVEREAAQQYIAQGRAGEVGCLPGGDGRDGWIDITPRSPYVVEIRGGAGAWQVSLASANEVSRGERVWTVFSARTVRR